MDTRSTQFSHRMRCNARGFSLAGPDSPSQVLAQQPVRASAMWGELGARVAPPPPHTRSRRAGAQRLVPVTYARALPMPTEDTRMCARFVRINCRAPPWPCRRGHPAGLTPPSSPSIFLPPNQTERKERNVTARPRVSQSNCHQHRALARLYIPWPGGPSSSVLTAYQAISSLPEDTLPPSLQA
jgi:hypothetical protein